MTLNYKNNKEAEAISFDSKNMEPYNRLITVQELQLSLEKAKNTAPGSNGVSYQMIKQLPQYLCKIFNKFFRDSYFPVQWKMAIVVSIPKPGKSLSISTTTDP